MSWAEDNGIDSGGWENSGEILVQDWYSGIHTGRDGEEYKISKMTNSHLLNTIRYFAHLDTTPLEKEAKRRGLL